jgi:hypothetical protein
MGRSRGFKLTACTFCGSHGGECVAGCLLGCRAVQTAMNLPTFQRFLVLSS